MVRSEVTVPLLWIVSDRNGAGRGDRDGENGVRRAGGAKDGSRGRFSQAMALAPC